MNGTDERLRAAYRELLARRAAAAGALPATLEEIEALARDGADSPERTALLDRVLADPRTRDEYRLLREVGAGPDAPATRPAAAPAPWRWALAAAAVAVLAVGAGVLSRASRVAGPDPVRGDRDAVRLVAPAPGAALEPGTTFVWHAAPGAVSYELELLSESGEVLARVGTAETVATPGALADPALAAGARWLVTARLAAGGTQRSEARPLAR
jgi:hypothetical protein